MPRGRPPKKDIESQENKEVSVPKKRGVKSFKDTFVCFSCGKESVETNFYNSNSEFYSNTGKIPYCKQCIENFYQQYCDQYANEGCSTPAKKAVQRLCMLFDIYYKDDVFNSAVDNARKRETNISPMSAYMKMIQLVQYKNKTYENTISEAEQESFVMSSLANISDEITVDQKTIDFFGNGFANDDYIFLKREYEDWTARHECNTKAQEEVIKDICFNRLQNLKALRKGEDTKDITASFQKMLDAGKLQPKQNVGDATADNQTFGTLIDKWENEKPIPEIDEDLRDVDKIGLYLEIFFKGHLAKMMGLKNGLSNLYTKFMKKYTVEKPEYNDNEDGEALFDAIFGNVSED